MLQNNALDSDVCYHIYRRKWSTRPSVTWGHL